MIELCIPFPLLLRTNEDIRELSRHIEAAVSWGGALRDPNNGCEGDSAYRRVFGPMFVVNIESAKKQQSNEENIHSSTCVYLVSLDYEISVPHIIRHNRLLV